MEKQNSAGELVGHVIADVLGFFWCLALLCGAFGIGAWAARYLLGESHRDAVGVLAAIAFIWLYERQRAENRAQRMNEAFDRLFERLSA